MCCVENYTAQLFRLYKTKSAILNSLSVFYAFKESIFLPSSKIGISAMWWLQMVSKYLTII